MTITTIQQGDKYYLPVRIKEGESYIEPGGADGVRVKVGTFLETYPSGDLAWGKIDDPSNPGTDIWVWLYPVTQKKSLAWNGGEMPMQTQIKRGNTTLTSKTKFVWIDTSIIKERW